MADQEGQAQRKVDAITARVDLLTQSLLLANEKQLKQQITHSEESARISEARAALEKELRDRIVSTQQEIEAGKGHGRPRWPISSVSEEQDRCDNRTSRLANTIASVGEE